MENVAHDTDKNTASAQELEEAVARKLCEGAGYHPDRRFYPVNSSHRDIYWPIWQEFRKDAQEIIALVGQAGRRSA